MDSPKLRIPILYEDHYFVAFDKPSGMLVIPTPLKENHTLVRLVNLQQKENSSSGFLYPCHRLDRDTSGVILFAKGKKHQQVLMETFRQQKMKKIYLAFIHGVLKASEGELKGMIKDLDEQKFRKRSPPKMALTRYRVLETRKFFSVIEVFPLTGRTNQIRIQFSQIGHPLVGERKYAFARDFSLRFRRTALHAHQLQFQHPWEGKPVMITSPLPQDMEDFLERNKN